MVCLNEFPIKYPKFYPIGDSPFNVLSNNCHYHNIIEFGTSCTIGDGLIISDFDLSSPQSFKLVCVQHAMSVRKFAEQVGYTSPLQIFFDTEDNIFDIRTVDGFMSWQLLNSLFGGIVPLNKPVFTGTYASDNKNPIPDGEWIIKPAVSVVDDLDLPIYVKATTSEIQYYQDNINISGQHT